MLETATVEISELCEAEIEAGVIDEHERVRAGRFQFGQHPVELRAEIAVLLQHVPKAHDGFVRPIEEIAPGDGAHLRSAGSCEAEVWRFFMQRGH